MELETESSNEPQKPQLNIGAVRRSCLTCKYAIRFNNYNNDGKCGNENSEAFKRNENNRTLFGSVCDLHNYA
jgi:hypothetical protein